jgi:type I restriction-modification system DNA methylase subunit
VLWPGILLIEQKSAGKDLDKAEIQARDYLISLDPSKRPAVFIVGDFKKLRIVDVLANTSIEFALSDLPEHLHRFEAILGLYTKGITHKEISADTHAARLMAELYISFENAGYEGHEVSVFLVRILFLLFGDDTRMWKRGAIGLFEEIVANSAKDGTGLGATIQELFQVLNTPKEKRHTTISPYMADFPYINGGLFAEQLPIFSFTPQMRTALYEANLYNYSAINPAIFGALFQEVKSKADRREMGEHYTSEADILKVIGPLFLADFNDRLHKVWDSPIALKRFHNELSSFTYLDPACGCGNFLVVAYKKMRELELKVIARLRELDGTSAYMSFDGTLGLKVHLSQFYGIEYEEWSSQIAQVAMFLADHQANLALEEITGEAPNRFPLSESATIIYANALRVNWEEICPIDENTFIMGNPPFTGMPNAEQSEDTELVWNGSSLNGSVDYVANWYLLAARHIERTGCRAAFVSTNSITQGEQPPAIWGQLYPLGIGIDFAHRTFAWQNGAAGQAAVHIVIIGFSNRPKSKSLPLWTYETPKSKPVLTLASNINAYLIDAPNILIRGRTNPLEPKTQPMIYGNKPTDGGFLSNISPQEAEEIRKSDWIAAKYLRRIIGAEELIHDGERYCLWLEGMDPSEIRRSKVLTERVNAVRQMRENSKKKKTQEDAKRPTEFQEIRQPKSAYLAIPRVSSEEREYVPIQRYEPDVIVNDAVFIIEDASMATFGIIHSRPFNIWNKAISGRLKNDTRISNTITYNNFPFPDVSGDLLVAIEDAAENVIRARASLNITDLSILYDKLAMPIQLRRAHQELDKAVLAVLGLSGKTSDEKILMVLFERYEELTAGLFPTQPSPRRRRAS